MTREPHTQIDVLMLYSEMAQEMLGDISDEQMITVITDAIASTNEAFVNSDIDVHYRLVHVAKVRVTTFVRGIGIYTQVRNKRVLAGASYPQFIASLGYGTFQASRKMFVQYEPGSDPNRYHVV